jgi:molybdate transport system substrate-binding protein
MKKILAILLALMMLTALAVPSAFAAGEKTELIVFAAASMTETLNQIKDLYEAANPDVALVFNFDSSGTLKTQIQEGADCDVFISAAPKQMNQLDASCDSEKNPDGLDFVEQGTRLNLLENKVVLAVPEGNPKGIESFDQLAELLAAGDVFLAMGNSDVPVGQYTQKILAYYGLDEEELVKAGVITYGSNVKEVTTQVSEASVDCGIVYATDAYSAGLDSVDAATAEMCGQVIYPAAVLNISKNMDAAKAFLAYLTGPEASQVFESVGFTAISDEPGELIVFAAASMTETLNQIKELYEAKHPTVTLVYNFDSSGTLKTQIQEGADCDVFISAAPKQMNQLDAACDSEKNPDGLDFVKQGTRINLLENKVVLAVPDGNPKGLASFDQLAELLAAGDVFLAMGNSDVPVGQYTQKILAFYGLNEEDLAKAGVITYGSNVKEVTTQVKEGSVDCGVVYATDAFSAGLDSVDSATAEMCGQVIYPAAVLNITERPRAAQAYLDYLTGSEAMEVFESVGFSPAA